MKLLIKSTIFLTICLILVIIVVFGARITSFFGEKELEIEENGVKGVELEEEKEDIKEENLLQIVEKVEKQENEEIVVTEEPEERQQELLLGSRMEFSLSKEIITTIGATTLLVEVYPEDREIEKVLLYLNDDIIHTCTTDSCSKKVGPFQDGIGLEYNTHAIVQFRDKAEIISKILSFEVVEAGENPEIFVSFEPGDEVIKSNQLIKIISVVNPAEKTVYSNSIFVNNKQKKVCFNEKPCEYMGVVSSVLGHTPLEDEVMKYKAMVVFEDGTMMITDVNSVSVQGTSKANPSVGITISPDVEAIDSMDSITLSFSVDSDGKTIVYTQIIVNDEVKKTCYTSNECMQTGQVYEILGSIPIGDTEMIYSGKVFFSDGSFVETDPQTILVTSKGLVG